ncbi:MAG: saccharopine dehydrogenase NADP-binding domain-containing protein [Chitinophagaceae bacterium]|nr:saccharopine dehydrogenase NADP-binding domain-containing protein [Chitinophagaceae bacterium]
MKKILLLGAGKSATVLIEYLKKKCIVYHWHLTVADNDLQLVESKLKGAQNTTAAAINIHDEEQRKSFIREADTVISMLPASLHFLVAKTCIETGRHLLTASYVDENIRASAPAIKEKGLLFLCEIGLDPGIDHMSAMQLIHRIQNNGAKITSFHSHCGGLVAPESDDNPWHYKISWNPRNIILAGKAGAVYKENGLEATMPYERLFDETRSVEIPGYGAYSWYPNRDSLSYSRLYGLEDAGTFIRTTLRHPDFCYGWKKVVELKLTDEDKRYDTDNLSYLSFFNQHLAAHELADTSSSKQKEMLAYLDLYSDKIIGKGVLASAEIVQHCAEQKLILRAQDHDMIIMMHEIGYEENGDKKKLQSTLVVKGDNNLETAMAKTVGLPLGIAAVMVLNDEIKLRGLQIPVLKEIYEPVLSALREEGIVFQEK